MTEKSKRDEIQEVVNKLFIYTDRQQWSSLIEEVFAEEVIFDMSLISKQVAAKTRALDICKQWEQGFQGLDAVHHQSGNHLVTISDEDTATVFCYAIAYHYRKSASKGTVREFVGEYDIQLVLTDIGWRVNGFKYTPKFVKGNITLE